ncbi:hypothetical protein ACFXKG_00910 [Streptomyces sp. NPDC059255]|uniref:hypothetical protein n=1 Tax=Streptomyces sp. NPDC059255 TaxID=3346793 RepID=UPI0036CBEFE0
MRARTVAAQCTIHLRHETDRRPHEKHSSLIQYSYVLSSRDVERPEHGKATVLMTCDFCGHRAGFSVFSVTCTRRLRALWFGLLLLLSGLSAVPFFWLAEVFGLFRNYFLALPQWLSVGLAVAGVLATRVVFFRHFYWADEFGVRALHRWRYSGSHELSDEQ